MTRDYRNVGSIEREPGEPESHTIEDVARQHLAVIKEDCTHLAACKCAQLARSRCGLSLPLDCRWCESYQPRKGGATLGEHGDRSHGK